MVTTTSLDIPFYAWKHFQWQIFFLVSNLNTPWGNLSPLPPILSLLVEIGYWSFDQYKYLKDKASGYVSPFFLFLSKLYVSTKLGPCTTTDYNNRSKDLTMNHQINTLGPPRFRVFCRNCRLNSNECLESFKDSMPKCVSFQRSDQIYKAV